MNFSVMSRENAKRYTYEPNIKDCIIISISDTDMQGNSFSDNPHIKAILRLWFDDVEKDNPNCITEQQTESIIKFVNEHINEVDEIVVHCGAGISRSAGVCAALMKIINGDDMPIFNSHKYKPNSACYYGVLAKYYGSYNVQAISEEFKQNIQHRCN